MAQLFDELNSIADLQRLIDADERESETLEYKTASQRLQPSDRQEAAKDFPHSRIFSEGC